MFLFTVAFLLGDLCLQSLSVLPSFAMVMEGGVAVFVFYLLADSNYRWVQIILIAFSTGFVWAYGYSSYLLSWSLPKKDEGQAIFLTGYIASLPEIDKWQSTFLFSISHALIKLSWRNPPEFLRVGDQWRLKVKLKRIHGNQNPGTFDYEAWALHKGIRAKGYVVNDGYKKISSARFAYCVNQLRQKLQKKILLYSPATPTAPWLMALIIGERNNIRPEDWDVLRKTGTNHLMAIAGLHIGIIAGLAHFIFKWLSRRSARLLLIMPAQIVGGLGALLTTILYSALAGFSLPTQRASIMLIIFLCGLFLRRHLNHWQTWALAMIVVLLMNPLDVLTETFWLSFGTIALIIYGMSGRLAPSGWWWKWGRVQWVIGFGLLPLSLLFFQEGSLISFFANSIAIPWLGILILPFCFLSSLFLLWFPWMGKMLLILADKNLAILWWFLTKLSHYDFSTWEQAIPQWGLFSLSFLGVILLLLPSGFPGRWFGIMGLLPIFLQKPTSPSNNHYWLSMLDVGQGLAVVVQTKRHALVFDAGAKLDESYDMGKSVVMPFLKHQGIKKIDMLVISHGDNDHIGGAFTLINHFAIGEVQSSVPQLLPIANSHYCMQGYSWEWDGVHFSFLHPQDEDLQQDNKNNASCVLKIDNGKYSSLLTGDIEKNAEKKLLANFSIQQLTVDVLTAPHHGSKTSGLPEFIYAVHPHYVLYSTGYRNRYHFPHPSVVKTYTEINTSQLDTAFLGAILFKFENTIDLKCYRIVHSRYWLD